MAIDIEKVGVKALQFTQTASLVLDRIFESKKTVDQPYRFYYSIFLKINSLLDALSFQVFNIGRKPHYTYAVCLSLRTCMLDILNVYYVLDKTEDPIQQQQRINILMADQLTYVYHQLKKERKLELQRDWPELFDTEKNLRSFEKPKPSYLVKEVQIVDIKKEVTLVKHYYDILSKYEHNGAFTFDLLHNVYSEEGKENPNFLITDGIRSVALVLRVLASNWVIEKDDPLHIKLENDFLALC